MKAGGRCDLTAARATEAQYADACAAARAPREWAAAVTLLTVRCESRAFMMRRPPRGHSVATCSTPLTNFADSATSPALSPVAGCCVIRGPLTFLSPGQIYVKRLPEGEPMQLTNGGEDKWRSVPAGRCDGFPIYGDWRREPVDGHLVWCLSVGGHRADSDEREA